ncbi:hypothetical protein H0H93_009442, partial [Arthromyces matolae]
MLFKGKGVLIQPTPENKPKSTVTIIEFRTQAQIQTFFGDELKPLQGNNWTRGARTWGAGFGGMGSTFTKSTKIGPVDITIRNLDINYSKNNMKCTLKFEMAQVGGALYAPISADVDEKGTHRLVSEAPPSTGHTSGAHGHDTTTTMQETVLNTFVFALALLEKLTECAPVPGLKGAVGIFHVVMQRFEGAEQNMDDMEELVKAVDAFNNILSKFEDSSGTGRGLSDDLGEQLFMLSRELTAIKSQALVISRHSRFRRMIESQHDAHVITSGFRRLQGLIHVILVGSALKTEARLADLWALEHLDKLPRAKDARYDYVDLPLCSEGTREGVLNQIMSWAKDKDAHQIYWLNGGAGTGKTTIALTIASMLAKDTSIFSASFFCSRSSESRSDSRLIFPTFSYLFARCDVKLRNRIVRVIRQMPDVGHALPGEQLMKLLVDPLRR